MLADKEQRIRALTDLAATLLIEAAAGTGKTSLLAGRVACLLANGVQPGAIAAITFTEFSAGELRERITRYVEAIVLGRVPDELRLAFPNRPAEWQLENLQEARKRLDQLTCTTIHGFCHALLRTYAVEAVIDPGAEIIDSTQADLAFRTIFERWLRDRLIVWGLQTMRSLEVRKRIRSEQKNCCAVLLNSGEDIARRNR
jgi:CRISPR-associated exonuclease Cas4